ncbi:MAG: hydrogenase maturation nickel metallochaperone HypA [Roseiflexaceae bacterium]
MHELSIAMSLVELASTAARDAGVERVTALHVRIGALSGVVREALSFSFEIAAADTPIAGAQLVFEHVPVAIFCTPCHQVVELVSIQSFRCPVCGTPSAQIVHGRELDLVALEHGEVEAEEAIYDNATIA